MLPAKRLNAPGPLRADRRPKLSLASPPDPPLLSSAVWASRPPPRQCSLTPFSPPKFDLKFHLHFFRLFSIFQPKFFPTWNQNRLQNPIFWLLFCNTFRDNVLGSILHRFLKAPTLKNINLIEEKQGFSLNRRLQKSFKNEFILSPFWLQKPSKIAKKTSSNTCLFLPSFLEGVFLIFCGLGVILGGPGATKKRPKMQKNGQKTSSERTLVSEVFFASIFGAF